MPDVEILRRARSAIVAREKAAATRGERGRTLMPSWEKHGGTAEDSSSASLRSTGNSSTADMGMSPR